MRVSSWLTSATLVLALGVLSAAEASAGTAPPGPAGTASASAAPAALHVAPGGTGRRDGTGWDNAGDLSDLPRFVAARPGGGQIWVRGDAGPYRVTKTVVLTGGGTPLLARRRPRRRRRGGATVRPLIIGTRTSPYRPGGEVGPEIFELRWGARNLSFSNLAFQDLGSALVVGGDTQQLGVSDMTATNVRFFLDNLRAKDEPTAHLTGLTMRRVTVRGFSKSALHLRYDSSHALVEDVDADSQQQQQDGDDFAMGVACRTGRTTSSCAGSR